MAITDIRKKLFSLQDIGYRDFQAKLTPTIDPETAVGVRTPALRQLARELYGTKEAESFLRMLPHEYFDENQLHAFLISLEKDFNVCLREVEAFLPFIDNWATCDQLSPKVFRKNKDGLLPIIKKWISSGHTYTVRFAVGMLMQHFLDDDFKKEYADMVSALRSDEYYINMMKAWYFATALAKQYECAVTYLEDKKLDAWTHNKTIQKAVESFRVPDDRKEYLKTLKVRR